MKTERRTANSGSSKRSEISFAKKPLRQTKFLAAVVVLLILLGWAYSNHFENPFEFDDSHTIVNNTAIRDLGNFSRFFSDSTTSSTLPANRAWRPGLTTLNAIDYAIQNKMNECVKKDSLGKAAGFQNTFCPKWMKQVKAGTNMAINPFWFHFSIFLSFLLLGFFLFHFLNFIFSKIFPELNYSHWAALLGTSWFLLHTANAETINYIISRDDSFSTMMVLLAFVIYLRSPLARKYFLFLIPVVIGYFVKEPTVMFAPLLLVYVWLFGDVDKNKKRMYAQIGISFLIAGILYFLTRAMTPAHHTYGGGDWTTYLCTQAFVIFHYFNSFLLPTNLSADTDWSLVTSAFDDRVLAGTFFIIALFVVAWKCSMIQKTKPISFGILWFFIALAPTSLFPLSEVLNDHRPFFAYIGLIIAFVTAGILLFEKISFFKNSMTKKTVAIIFCGIILVSHAFGTHHRNEVWSSGETLWKDVTEKSPGNGRGWMNYGLALMGRTSKDTAIARLNTDSAIICLSKALAIYPSYSYANINMAIAQSRIGNDKGAESYYSKAVAVDPYNPECYYFYGLYLIKMQRTDEALKILLKGKEISPQHEGINLSLSSIANFKSPVQIAQETTKKNPTAENYVNLSLAFYNNKQFLESAIAAKEAARLKPEYGVAWNNVCAAYNKIGEFDSAMLAGSKAVMLQPNDELSKNNFIYAQQQKNRFDKLEENAKQHVTYENWLNLSLEWDKVANYKKSMIAAQEATLINPNDPLGWNNICAAANKLGDWDRAIVAGEKAVKLNPNFELAKNNLAEARKGKESSGH